MISRRFLGALALCTAAIMQCTSNDPTGGGSAIPGPGYVKAMEMFYTVSGTNRITTIRTNTECNGSILVTTFDTSLDMYIVTAESLYVLDTMAGTDTSAAAVRLGSGTGLIGTWRESNSSLGLDIDLIYVISSISIQGWVKKSDLIAGIRASFAEADSSGSAFSGFTIDTSVADRIMITGNTTHEVVTLTIADNGAFRWSSSNPLHATEDINMFSGPATCPENDLGPIPSWYLEFAMANGPLVKRSALSQLRFALKFFGK
jgi:hypothetical protein